MSLASLCVSRSKMRFSLAMRSSSIFRSYSAFLSAGKRCLELRRMPPTICATRTLGGGTAFAAGSTTSAALAFVPSFRLGILDGKGSA